MKLSSVSLIASTLATIAGCAIATPIPSHARVSLFGYNVERHGVVLKSIDACKTASTYAKLVENCPREHQKATWREHGELFRNKAESLQSISDTPRSLTKDDMRHAADVQRGAEEITENAIHALDEHGRHEGSRDKALSVLGLKTWPLKGKGKEG